jgi:hypothetical protein
MYMYVCVLGVSISPISTIFLLDLRTVPSVWLYILFSSYHYLLDAFSFSILMQIKKNISNFQ